MGRDWQYDVDPSVVGTTGGATTCMIIFLIVLIYLFFHDSK